MNKTVFHLFILIGAVFSLLASLIAYLVTYKEEEHHYSNKKEAIKRAFQMERQEKGLSKWPFLLLFFSSY